MGCGQIYEKVNGEWHRDGQGTCLWGWRCAPVGTDSFMSPCVCACVMNPGSSPSTTVFFVDLTYCFTVTSLEWVIHHHCPAAAAAAIYGHWLQTQTLIYTHAHTHSQRPTPNHGNLYENSMHKLCATGSEVKQQRYTERSREQKERVEVCEIPATVLFHSLCCFVSSGHVAYTPIRLNYNPAPDLKRLVCSLKDMHWNTYKNPSPWNPHTFARFQLFLEISFSNPVSIFFFSFNTEYEIKYIGAAHVVVQ